MPEEDVLTSGEHARRRVSLIIHALRQITTVLERQPCTRVVVMGVILGLGLGIPGFFYLRSPAWMLLWGGLFVALWRMAAYAEPVFEEANPVVVEARPMRV
jgi:hypothetical protein